MSEPLCGDKGNPGNKNTVHIVRFGLANTRDVAGIALCRVLAVYFYAFPGVLRIFSVQVPL
jgi:hypothetical protein